MSSVQNNKTNNIRNKIVVYFRLQERIESIEFSPESTSSDDLKGKMRKQQQQKLRHFVYIRIEFSAFSNYYLKKIRNISISS